MTSAAVSLATKRLAALTEGLGSTFWFLWAGMLVNRAGSFVVPLLTVYLTTVRGLSLVEAGSIVAVFGAGSMGGTLLGGALADRLGRRATLLLALTSGAAMMLTLGAAESVPAITASAFALGLALDMFRPAAWTVVADVVAPEYRLKAFSTLYWAVNLGFAFASSVGGALALTHFRALFVADALSMLAFAAIVLFKVPETRPTSATTRDEGHLFTPMLDRRFAPFMVLNLLTAMIFFQFLAALPEDMRQKGLTPAAYGLAIAMNGVLIVLLQPFVTQWTARRSRTGVLAFATFITGLGFGLTAFAHTLPAYIVTVVVWTVGEILMSPVNSSLVADLAPKALRGRYQGAFGLTWSVAMMLSTSLSPRLATVVGLRGLWFACAVLGGLLTVGHLVVTRRTVATLRAEAR